MKCFSLFSGIGGFDLALTQLGHEIVGACEIDEYARSVYAGHFPKVKIWKDATKINPTELPEFQLLCAGFPCQSFSCAGGRRGFEDTRGTLFFEIIRIAREKQPSILLLENVKGLLSHDKGQTFATIKDALDEVGYDCSWFIINSKYYLPQNRERVFITANLRKGEPGSRKVLPFRHFGKEVHKEKSLERVGNIDQKGHNSIWGRVYNPEGISATLNAQAGGLGAKGGIYVVADRSRTKAGLGRRLESPKEITNSLTSVAKDNLVYYDNRLRRLTPLEWERLQGFPENWTTGSDSQRYKMLGNAVTVPVVRSILEQLRPQIL